MRNLQRDTEAVYISRYLGIEREEDASGRLTGKNMPSMSEPEVFYPSISMARGEAYGAYFGMNLDYDKVLTIDNPTFAVSEADRLWIGGVTSAPHNYVVKKVAHKGNFTVIAAKHVEVRQ